MTQTTGANNFPVKHEGETAEFVNFKLSATVCTEQYKKKKKSTDANFLTL